MPPISLQVIAPVMTNFYHCIHCEQIFNQAGMGQQVHQEEIDQYPEDVRQDFTRLADWLFEIAHQYGDQIRIQVIDPQSIEEIITLLDTKVSHIHRQRSGEAHWMG
ncbi:MAG: hypothetical protein AMJ88_19195 [Anaerolineae bacterium SM23_ 63]|nr:MAG: hypothetical protein AMJ88_19195 [Anaerolineae bacterium SM23_ 63]